MAQRSLDMTIVLGGRVDNTFTRLGESLMQLGMMANQVSRVLIKFGKESIETYKNYELSMQDARAALSSQYKDVEQLEKVMKGLDAAASDWAENSIFHTKEIAATIATMSHAGLEYEQIMASMPAAMRLAQAGSMDLDTAFSQLNDSLLSMGLNYDYATQFVDQWTYAANNANTTISELGEAFTTMGATAFFGNTSAEVLTMLDMLADHGIKGSQAGTLLRGAMIRLIVPTTKAEKALEDLGVTSDEVQSALNDAGVSADDLSEVYQTLNEAGFSAFDDNGTLKNWVDIWNGLHVTLNGLFGEDYMHNQQALGIIGSIFPTRTITGATSLLQGFGAGAADEVYRGILEQSEGYGQQVADTMNDSLYGATELFKSKWEELQKRTGGTLAGPLEGVYEYVGGFIDKLNELPDDKFEMLVTGLSGVAAVGPALLASGLALRFIGYLLSPGGMLLLGITALAEGIALSHEKFKQSFGDMEVDMPALMGYVQSLGNSFDEAHGFINEFNVALDTSVTKYKDASSAFSSKLLTNVLNENVLTQDDIDTLNKLGQQMYDSVVEGINIGTDGSMTYWATMFGLDKDTQTIINSLGSEYDRMLADAAAIGQNIRDAVAKALEGDGKIDEAEYDNILEYMREYNALVAKAAKQAAMENEEAALEVMLHKAQGMSYEDAMTLAGEAITQRDNRLSENDEAYELERATAAVALRHDGYSEADIARILGSKDVEHEADNQALRQTYDTYLLRLAQQMMFSNGADEDLAFLQQSKDDYQKTVEYWAAKGKSVPHGVATWDDKYRYYIRDKYGDSSYLSPWGDGRQSYNLYGEIVNTMFGGSSNALAEVSALTASGNLQQARQLLEIVQAYEAYYSSPGDVSWYGKAEETNLIAAENALQQQTAQQIAAAQQYANQNPVVVPVITGSAGSGGNVKPGLPLFAEGGRATSPSIFGEAGAEWAIPEQHTLETARLLAQAAAASGFTWPEIAAAAGGGGTLVYSPTIYAADASGVEEKLIADKERLERYLRERAARGRAEVYS